MSGYLTPHLERRREDAGVEYVHVEWPMAPGEHYELQRSDELDRAWRPVAQVRPAHRAVAFFSDYEARIGVSTYYRVRVVRR